MSLVLLGDVVALGQLVGWRWQFGLAFNLAHRHKGLSQIVVELFNKILGD